MDSIGELGDDVQPRHYWKWGRPWCLLRGILSKWGTYQSVLSYTNMSLIKDHLISRSNDAEEIRELHEQTENDLKQCLTWGNHTCFRFGAVSGADIFVLTGQEAHEYAGPASVSSYVASGVSAMLCLLLHRICSRNPSSSICLLKDSFRWLCSFHNIGKPAWEQCWNCSSCQSMGVLLYDSTEPPHWLIKHS